MQKMQLALYAALISSGLAAIALEKTNQQHFLGVADDPDQYKDITASDKTCYVLCIVVIVGFIVQSLGQYVMANKIMEIGGGVTNLVGCLFCMAYAWHHGLMAAYWNQTIDPVEHNYCNSVGIVGIIFVGFSLCLCCFSVPVFYVLASMNKDSEKILQMMEVMEQERLKKAFREEEFKGKCSKAFKAADADGNGKLDLTELQHVSLDIFAIPDRLKDIVKEHDLFKKAFVEKDANKDKLIDEDEFLEVMKWIVVKAKSEADEAESEQITQTISKKDVA